MRFSNIQPLQLLVVVGIAMLISVLFRWMVFKFTSFEGMKFKKMIPFVSWMKGKRRAKTINIIFDFFFMPLVLLLYILKSTSQNEIILILEVFSIAVFISLGMVDWYTLRLPNILILLGLIFGLILLFTNFSEYPDYIFGLLAGLFIGFGIRFFGKAWYIKEVFGLGDVKLMGLLGFYTGWQYFLPVFLTGMLLASLYSVIAVIFGSLQWKSKIPLGSFLCMALILFVIMDHSWLAFISMKY
jgi:prepilin signal peptidase PulO-like enzyme (type II secretory pathway)